MEHLLKVTSVSRVAFDDERIDAEGDSISARIHVKDGEQHGKILPGDEITVSIDIAKAKKSKKK